MLSNPCEKCPWLFKERLHLLHKHEPPFKRLVRFFVWLVQEETIGLWPELKNRKGTFKSQLQLQSLQHLQKPHSRLWFWDY